jgi:ABC-2 type transport system permease protein
VVTGYALALTTLAVLYLAGLSLGVSLPAGGWIRMTLLILVGLLPFAPLGVTLGHLLTVDSIGPAMGWLTAIFALLGGTWFPIATSGVMYDVARCLPSYWLVQAAHVGLGGPGWGVTGWLVTAVWTAALTATARAAFRRDTARA